MVNYGDKRMTTNEVCRALGCDRTTLMRNWREIETYAGATQVKKIENGKSTYWTEAELTLLLEKMKGNANNQHDLVSRSQGTETSQSRVFRLQVLQKQMQDIYEAEIADLRTKNRLLEDVNADLSSGLATIQRIAEAGGLMLTDRDDLVSAYRGRR